jgi:hypothetical protein
VWPPPGGAAPSGGRFAHGRCQNAVMIGPFW